jgi:hypothetical protein
MNQCFISDSKEPDLEGTLEGISSNPDIAASIGDDKNPIILTCLAHSAPYASCTEYLDDNCTKDAQASIV